MNSSSLPNFRGLDRSRIIQGCHTTLTFPDRQDYINYLILQGYIKSENELYCRSDLVSAVQCHWRLLGQTGCKFAQVVSKNPLKHGWRTEVLQDVESEQISHKTILRVEQLVDKALEDVQIELISLIFPQLQSPFALVSLIRSVANLRKWSFTILERECIDLPLTLLPIALRIRLNEEGISSWVMGFGPFTFLANTRQSPFTELVIRTKPKPSGPLFHLDNQDRMLAHVADIPAFLPLNTYAHLWAITHQSRKDIIGSGDDLAGKSRVTFVIPSLVWYF